MADGDLVAYVDRLGGDGSGGDGVPAVADAGMVVDKGVATDSDEVGGGGSGFPSERSPMFGRSRGSGVQYCQRDVSIRGKRS